MAKRRPSLECLEDLKDSRKNVYKTLEWKEREQYYIDCINEMDIPAEPTPTDIKEIIHVMDVVFSQAKIDFAMLKRSLDGYENRIYLRTKDLIIQYRQAGEAKSDEMAKALAIQTIMGENIAKNSKTTYSLYQISDTYKLRLTFVESIIGIISAKQRVLVTENGILKLETTFDGDDNS